MTLDPFDCKEIFTTITLDPFDCPLDPFDCKWRPKK